MKGYEYVDAADKMMLDIIADPDIDEAVTVAVLDAIVNKVGFYRISLPKNWTCCLCGLEQPGSPDLSGHNPAPVDEDPDARCCTRCNHSLVIPARLARLGKKPAKR